MSELELIELARGYDSLIEEAQAALRAEFAKRNLEPPLIEGPTEISSRTLVTVGSYRDLPHADLARAALESAGISAWIQDDNLVRMDWFYSNAIGGIRLQVDATDAEAASAILNQPTPSGIEFESGTEFIQPKCPRCGSLDITFSDTSRGASLVTLYLAALPIPSGTPTRVCEACGARWKDTNQSDSSTELK